MSEGSERSKVRLTVDMPPPLHRRLKQFTNAAALELDVADVAAAAVVRALVSRLTLQPGEDGYDDRVAKLVEQVIEDLRAQSAK